MKKYLLAGFLLFSGCKEVRDDARYFKDVVGLQAFSVEVGNTLYIPTFSVPVTPFFLDCQVKVEVEHETCVQLIRTAPYKINGEGKLNYTMQINAIKEGHSKIKCYLLTAEGHKIQNYMQVYMIKVTKKN